jgi:hypothetical protein
VLATVTIEQRSFLHIGHGREGRAGEAGAFDSGSGGVLIRRHRLGE